MPQRIETFIHGDIGPLEDLNPLLTVRKPYVPEILYIIANSLPYELGVKEIANRLACHPQLIGALLEKLTQLEMVKICAGRFSINFPVFVESDLPLLETLAQQAAIRIGNLILTRAGTLLELVLRLTASKNFPPERLLYHLVGDFVLDGKAFDFLTAKGLLVTEKPQPCTGNYLLIGFADDQRLQRFSDHLLCSSNNYWVDGVRFNSFGDSAGDRQDFYRFFRKVSTRIHDMWENDKLNQVYSQYLNEKNELLAKNCALLSRRLLAEDVSYNSLSDSERIALKLLKELGYVKTAGTSLAIAVPVFHNTELDILDELADEVLSAISGEVIKIFTTLAEEFPRLSAVRHGVSVKEIGNELWHQIFGHVNQYLSANGLITQPPKVAHQGSFLQSIFLC